MIIAPCKTCCDRAIGCHATCDRYAAYRAEKTKETDYTRAEVQRLYMSNTQIEWLRKREKTNKRRKKVNK